MANYTSNLQSQPSWLSEFDNSDMSYQFDENGLGFFGNNNGGEGGNGVYPIRTNFDIDGGSLCTIIFTFTYNQNCADHGICIFNSNVVPIWEWQTETSRIAFEYNCGYPVIVGRFSDTYDGEEESDGILEEGEIYTAKFVYDPINISITAFTYQGTEASGTPIHTASLSEKLPEGKYRIGISCDADPGDSEEYSYFSYLSITTNATATSCPITTCVVETQGVKCLFNGACSCPQWKTFDGAYYQQLLFVARIYDKFPRTIIFWQNRY